MMSIFKNFKTSITDALLTCTCQSITGKTCLTGTREASVIVGANSIGTAAVSVGSTFINVCENEELRTVCHVHVS